MTRVMVLELAYNRLHKHPGCHTGETYVTIVIDGVRVSFKKHPQGYKFYRMVAASGEITSMEVRREPQPPSERVVVSNFMQMSESPTGVEHW